MRAREQFHRDRAIKLGPWRLQVGASLVLMAAVLLFGAAPLWAQSSSASYQVPRQTIDGGAGRTSSASYAVEGSMGQPDASGALGSASYTLRGGFHRAATDAALPDALFRDGFEQP